MASARARLSRDGATRYPISACSNTVGGPFSAWVLCAGTAIVLCATVLVAASLQEWRDDRQLHRPLSRLCVGVALACLALGALRPAPPLLAVTLVVLLSAPWLYAVRHRLIADDISPSAGTRNSPH